MGTQVCSVYLLDTETQRFVLMATEGLNKRSIGKVSMAPSEGLVGLVGTREEPLNLENAAAHPRYRYFAETGEERYASFLGAPIGRRRTARVLPCAAGWQACSTARACRRERPPGPA
ncbi:TPA: hypothetical protein ACHFW9_003675 [Pseudomonas aeruginosa]